MKIIKQRTHKPAPKIIRRNPESKCPAGQRPKPCPPTDGVVDPFKFCGCEPATGPNDTITSDLKDPFGRPLPGSMRLSSTRQAAARPPMFATSFRRNPEDAGSGVTIPPVPLGPAVGVNRQGYPCFESYPFLQYGDETCEVACAGPGGGVYRTGAPCPSPVVPDPYTFVGYSPTIVVAPRLRRRRRRGRRLLPMPGPGRPGRPGVRRATLTASTGSASVRPGRSPGVGRSPAGRGPGRVAARNPCYNAAAQTGPLPPNVAEALSAIMATRTVPVRTDVAVAVNQAINGTAGSIEWRGLLFPGGRR